MPLQQALSNLGRVAILEADIPFYESIFEEITTSLEQRSPIVERGEMGCAYVGLGGLEEMYGGEASLVKTLIHAVPEYLGPKVGVAENKFVARVAALSARPGRAVKAPKDTRPFLASYPVEILPVKWTVISRLRSFGLETLGMVTPLPLGAIQAQFGPQGRLMWELANGIDRTPLVPRQPEEEAVARLSFPSPTASVGVIALAIDTLLGKAFVQPVLRGRYARYAALDGQVYYGPRWTQKVAFKEPMGGKGRTLFAIKSKLEAHPVPGPLEDLCLRLSGITGEAGRQTSLFHDVRRKAQLDQAIRQLAVTLERKPPVFRVREVEPWSRLPERRHALVEYAP
jgi:DNA polymerase-4/protein ImuB